ncbi:unnamed protein product [Adineta steineri]|uniref:Prostaglandin E synthase 2 n=1 Tax=Adineta steineri TaxID=433720 RepID=A0A815I8I9_9BILA|nr:unnamed protein product [Adineta steineri]CAF1600657.1 unnamed protein product [Adineta steineri]
MSLLFVSASRTCRSSFSRQHILLSTSRFQSTQINPEIHQTQNQQTKADYPSSSSSNSSRRYRFYFLSIAAGALIGGAYTFRQSRKYEGLMPEYITNSEQLQRKAMEARPMPPPVTKHITFDEGPRVNFPFKLTLYQYVTCPFCCKVRAYLNYNRIPYDIVEVNSVMRSETKWSIYKKVPILVIENEEIQLNDSSMIISAIESYLRMPTKRFENISKLYQSVVEKDEKGKLSFNYPNKYFLVEPLTNERVDPTKQVQTEKTKDDARDNDATTTTKNVNNQSSPWFFTKFFSKSKSEHKEGLVNIGSGTVTDNETKSITSYNKSSEQYKLERKWREWVDTKFVHTLSPNIYCTLNQSLNTFRWFSQAGDWEQIFPWYQRWIIVYVGAVVMRGVAGRLRKKYNLNDNVRISLYECANEWVKAVGNKNFLGGSQPNLADLNVYGILTAIQGCEAFQDLMSNTKIQPWFERMKHSVEPHFADNRLRATT